MFGFKKQKQNQKPIQEPKYSSEYEYKRYFYDVYINDEIMTLKTNYTTCGFESYVQQHIFKKGFIRLGAEIYPINKITKIKIKDTQVFRAKFKINDTMLSYYTPEVIIQDWIERIENDILYVSKII